MCSNPKQLKRKTECRFARILCRKSANRESFENKNGGNVCCVCLLSVCMSFNVCARTNCAYLYYVKRVFRWRKKEKRKENEHQKRKKKRK